MRLHPVRLAWIAALLALPLLVPPAPAQPPSQADLGGWQQALQDESPLVRKRAALALGRQRAAAAVPALEKLLQDPNADVRRAAAEALERIDGQVAAPAGNQERDKLAADLAEAQQRLKVLRDENARQQGEVQKLTDVVKQRNAEIATLQTQINQLQARLTEEQKTRAAERDRMVAAEIRARSALDRVEQLQAELADMQRKQPAVPRPPADLRGRVKAVDAQSGLVEINLGSDAGVTKGQVLEVFRIDPDPKNSLYLGRLTVVDVRPTEAVGRLTPATRRAAVQAGDQVAARIPAAAGIGRTEKLNAPPEGSPAPPPKR